MEVEILALISDRDSIQIYVSLSPNQMVIFLSEELLLATSEYQPIGLSVYTLIGQEILASISDLDLMITSIL
jgi:hypothetical protein